MAPEQASGKKGAVTTATDVYGLGAVLYALLTGEPPFRGETVLDTLTQVKEREPDPPSHGNRCVDRDLETICLKCLEKDPQRRYGSAEAVADDLERWLAGEPIRARPISRLTRLGCWCRRNPQVASLTGAVAVLGIFILVGLSVGTVWLWREKTQKEQALELAQENYKAAQDQQRESQRISARLALDRGLLLCEQGDVARGLLWLARGLEIDPADAAGLHRAFRANLGSWYRQLTSLHSLSVPLDSQQRNVRVHKPESPAREAGSLAGASGLSEPGNQTNRLGEAETGNPSSVLTRPQGRVWFMAMSPDGRVVLSASRDKTARLWELATGRPQGEPLWHQGDVRCGAFSPDGRIVVTGSEDKTARLWETATGRPLSRFFLHSAAVIAAAFSPDGKTVLTASAENQAQFWEADTGKPLGRAFSHPGQIKAVAFSPDGQTVLTGGWA
jgi:WD40 repeat protein